MHTDNRTGLNLEEMEAATGGLWEEIAEFGINVWDKVKKTVLKVAKQG